MKEESSISASALKPWLASSGGGSFYSDAVIFSVVGAEVHWRTLL
uniref:Uncharacterized protein n=1 Tax=Arundo donax TaxID=35708 RepID=A0A0A9B795_ARUDO